MPAIKEVTKEEMITRWTSPNSRPLFKGKLIDPSGCKCAQGDLLSCAGYSDEELQKMTQNFADKEVARILGISIIHACLLRNVNDKKDGCPELVLSNPASLLGKYGNQIINFWSVAAYDATATAAVAAYDATATAAVAAYDATATAAVADAATAVAADAAAAVAAYDATATAAAADAAADAAAAYAAAAYAADATADATATADAAAYAAYAAAAYAAAAYATAEKYHIIRKATWEIIGCDILEVQNRQPYFLAFFGYKTWAEVRAIGQ